MALYRGEEKRRGGMKRGEKEEKMILVINGV
jgi:hypothetical protein